MIEWRNACYGPYEVSNTGLVRRTARGSGTQAGKMLKPRLIRGYASVGLSHCGVVREFKVHKLVAEAFLGPRPPQHDINHKDGNKLNNCVDNLEYMWPDDNLKHLIENRLHCHGETHGSAKLTEEDVKEIRRLYYSGQYTQRELAEKYGITLGTINPMIKYRTWKHVMPEQSVLPNYARHRGVL